MKAQFKKIKSKYTMQNVFSYIPFHRTVKIVKYNKRLINNLDYSVEDIKNFLFFNKVIKPISNCEDYLPILKRILSYKNNNNYTNIIDSFCEYLNKSNEFIPQISIIKNNEYILNKLNSFKVGFNNKFLDYFYDDIDKLNFKKLSDFCKKYGKKIKEITFMDNKNNNDLSPMDSFIYKYIIINSNIKKIEDRYFDIDYLFDETMLSEFMILFDLQRDDFFFEDVYEELLENINENKMMEIIKGLDSYSLYLDDDISNYDINQIIDFSFIFMVNNGINIENLEITKIDSHNRLNFVKSIKNLKKLKSLIISQNSDKKLYNCISKKIKKDSLNRLEISLINFEEGYKIINKNKNSLMELTLEIKNLRKNTIKILTTLSDIINLRKLKIISGYQILNEENIQYLNLEKVEYLEIPLYINEFLFDLNTFFEKIPNLKKLIFNGINFQDGNAKEENFKRINSFKLNINLVKKLKKINFVNCKKNSSFFIIKLIELLSKSKIKENIKEIKIENCDFDNKINFNNLIILISSFTNIKSLSLNNITFETSQPINYDEINNFENLEKFYFKGLNYEQNEIKILFFLYKFSEKCQRLNELGFSCKGLNPYDLNLIFKIIKNYRLLIKLNIFDNYDKDDYYTNKEEGFYKEGINITSIFNYCMLDMKSIDFILEKNNKNYQKNIINKYFNKKNLDKKISNKKEKYFIYEKVINDSFYYRLFYSKKKKSFLIGN